MRLVTYNVLADPYIRPEYYPNVAPEHLDPAWRRPALARQILALDCDVVCLQEVTGPVFAALERDLGSGYTGRFGQKSGRPDGCATFVRAPAVLKECRAVHYRDGDPPSGHLALVCTVELHGQRLAVANTHLRWDPPGTPRARSLGVRQIEQVLFELHPTVIVGDLNAVPDSDVCAAVRAAGFRDVHGQTHQPTCNANASARRLDYVFVHPSLAADPLPLPSIDDHTPLPSAEHPSDHLPVVVTLGFP
ncbi:MAG: endonuclease/exonuclease/phosphatase family protein [Candidatus Eremiobacterota bacterium]